VYFSCGEEFHTRFLEELEKARQYIIIEFFIIKQGRMWDSVLDILVCKVNEGVSVTVMYDGFATLLTLPFNYCKTLRKLGINCVVYNPLFRINTRNHRKNAIIDGNVTFCGGLNLADNYINIGSKVGHWKDSAVMVRWSGDSRNTYYASVWYDAPHESISESIILDLINNAKKQICITTPYLAPGKKIISAMCAAARAGIDVRLIMPFIPDKRLIHAISKSNYKPLLEAGVRIFEYSPGFIHSKNIITDDNHAAVSTVNFDYRALYTNYECGVYFQGGEIIADIKHDFTQTQQISREITYNAYMRTSLLTRGIRRFCKVFTPLV
jgi:cardiolipin synthase